MDNQQAALPMAAAADVSIDPTVNPTTLRKHAAMMERPYNLHQSRASNKSNPKDPSFESTQSFTTATVLAAKNEPKRQSRATRLRTHPGFRSIENEVLAKEFKGSEVGESVLSDLRGEIEGMFPDFVHQPADKLQDLRGSRVGFDLD